jgi:hypothetical protein
MDRKCGTIIAILTVLCLVLGYATVTQAVTQAHARHGQPAEVAKALEAGAEAAAPEAGAACPDAAGGVCALEMPAFEPVTVSPSTRLSEFVGEWISPDKGRRGLTRVTISKEPGGLAVVPWALHCAGEKPYGEAKQPGPTARNPFQLRWEGGFAEQRLRFALLDDGRLRVDSVGVIMDPLSTKGSVVTDYLTRATPEQLKAHEKAQRAAAAQLKKAEEPPEPSAGGPAQAGGT